MSSSTTNHEEEETTEHVEMLVLTVKECFIYKVPPLRSASGHRAEDWGLATPLLTGCLKVFQADTKLRIVLYAFKNPNSMIVADESIVEFGQCPIEVKPHENIMNFVDGVIDSSRYYVLRIKDPQSSRTTLLGVGFREREQAFDFKNCLNEYVKYVDRMDLASKMASGTYTKDRSDSVHSDEGGDSSQALKQLEGEQHFSPLKDGEKIKVKLNINKHNNKSNPTPSQHGSTNHGLLKPPPAPVSETIFDPIVNQTSQSTGQTTEDDDWGDFTSSN